MRVIQQAELCAVAGAEGPDYCTGVPDAPFGYDFSSACNTHDQNYSADTSMTQEQADTQFLNDMLEICETNYDDAWLCTATAYVYYWGVDSFGSWFYDGA